MPLTMTYDVGSRVGGELASLLELYPTALYDSRVITGLSDGDPVGTWADGSGKGNDATQATAAKKPIYKTSIVNNLPVVRADGVDDTLSAAASLLSQPPFTVFFVGTSATAAGARRLWANGRYKRGEFDTSEQFTTAGVLDYTSSSGYWSAGTFIISALVYDTDFSVSYYKNGTLFQRVAGAADGAAGLSGFQIAASGASQFWGGDIALLMPIARKLTSAEFRGAHRLLGRDFNIAVTL